MPYRKNGISPDSLAVLHVADLPPSTFAVARRPSAAHSSAGGRRNDFVRPRRRFPSSRDATARRLGRVARRGGGGGAIASASTVRSRASAASRFRRWERCSEATIVSTPSTNRPDSRCSARAFRVGPNAEVLATSYDNSTRESVVLTPCPPGPLDRENRQESSAAGTTTEPVTRTPPSMSCSSIDRSAPHTRPRSRRDRRRGRPTSSLPQHITAVTSITSVRVRCRRYAPPTPDSGGARHPPQPGSRTAIGVPDASAPTHVGSSPARRARCPQALRHARVDTPAARHADELCQLSPRCGVMPDFNRVQSGVISLR